MCVCVCCLSSADSVRLFSSPPSLVQLIGMIYAIIIWVAFWWQTCDEWGGFQRIRYERTSELPSELTCKPALCFLRGFNDTSLAFFLSRSLNPRAVWMHWGHIFVPFFLIPSIFDAWERMRRPARCYILPSALQNISITGTSKKLQSTFIILRVASECTEVHNPWSQSSDHVWKINCLRPSRTGGWFLINFLFRSA